MRRAFALKHFRPGKVQLWGASLDFYRQLSLSQNSKLVAHSRNFLTTIGHRLPPRLMSPTLMNIDPSFAEFFQYTSGRWLWEEEQQLRDRFTPFNVLELQNAAVNSVGANKCVAMTKLAEGSFNKIFRLMMDDGSTVIARVPHPIVGPAYYTTASEVATMDFASSVLKIPTPRVYAWCAHSNNPVGCEYIIMEEAQGTKLEDMWENLSLEERIEIMNDVVSIEKKILSMSFNSYGNLYYATEAIPGTITAEISNEVPSEIRSAVMQRFSIGPVVERSFWSKERAKMDIDRGPWRHPQEYVASLAHREMKWIRCYAISKSADDQLVALAEQNSPDAHLSLLQKYLDVAPYLLPDNPEVVAPYLWHTDLHAGNIFVAQGHVSSIIDWQGTWAGPLILLARHPRLVDYDGDIILKAPANFKDLGTDEKMKIRRQMSSSIILSLYERRTAKENPLVDSVLRFPHGRIRCDPMQFVGDTWDDDIIPLKEALIRVERHWSELGFSSPCPIHFTEEQLRNHEQESEGWNDVQDFWNSVADIVSRDGWTPNHLYDDAVALFREMREAGLKSMTGKEKEDFGRQTAWIESHSQRGR